MQRCWQRLTGRKGEGGRGEASKWKCKYKYRKKATEQGAADMCISSGRDAKAKALTAKAKMLAKAVRLEGGRRPLGRRHKTITGNDSLELPKE